MANPIDRLVSWFNPQAGLARHRARQNLKRAYEAASPRDGWRPRRAGASANADHQADGKILRAKARALVQNVPYIAAALDEALVPDTIGTGIMVRATGAEAEKTNALFEEWAKVANADGRMDYHGLIKVAYAAMEQDGEVLVRLRPRRPSDNLPVPLQLQVLEIDWLDDTRTGSYNGNTIIQGIEYDQLGKVAAYWLWDQHPGDVVLVRGRKIQSSRVQAQSIIHLFNPKRPGQGRGFTRFAPVIARTRDTQTYEDAEIGRKNLEARLSVLASGDTSGLEHPAASGNPTGAGGGVQDLGELGGGNIIGMAAGLNFTVVEPKAAPGYVDYIKLQLHIISAAIGVPYEAITGDMSEVNFSSARVRLLAYRRSVQQVQWLVLVPMLLRPIYEAFIDAAYLAGKIRTPDKAVDFSMPKWDYVNPEQEVKADTAEIAAGLSTPSEKLRQRGYDPDTVYNELASDLKKFKELGILETLLFMQRGNMPTAPGSGDASPPEK
ncbi:phage portal protein [Massilia sp. Root1485]|uniref:phage portal protein n=1 Tax=Massilia sp. Root1485 TaxID=1736472 RepID=UPI0006F76CE8|nr:phage portal protein [Massilia sp. Root1485]KQZ34288.1 Portal protein B [Massilia sp. Root1485]